MYILLIKFHLNEIIGLLNTNACVNGYEVFNKNFKLGSVYSIQPYSIRTRNEVLLIKIWRWDRLRLT
jgi:hypothetical protein